jgi:Domain of unknown function (4846)
MCNKSIFFISFLLCCSCNNNAKSTTQNNNNVIIPIKGALKKYEHIKDIPLPKGYALIENDQNSFASWLTNIKLKTDNTVYTFDGRKKNNQNAQFAVLDITVGNKDLQQCADAVMRLRAEYLFAQQKMKDIDFIDNEGVHYTFNEPYSYIHLTKYLDKVFGMCGSASLAKQLKQKNNFTNIEAGDVIIRGGFPGHAVIVINVAVNDTGKKIYMIAQSYMPAQDIHILKNPTNENLSPWYEVNDNTTIITPEYTFKNTELMCW